MTGVGNEGVWCRVRVVIFPRAVRYGEELCPFWEILGVLPPGNVQFGALAKSRDFPSVDTQIELNEFNKDAEYYHWLFSMCVCVCVCVVLCITANCVTVTSLISSSSRNADVALVSFQIDFTLVFHCR